MKKLIFILITIFVLGLTSCTTTNSEENKFADPTVTEVEYEVAYRSLSGKMIKDTCTTIIISVAPIKIINGDYHEDEHNTIGYINYVNDIMPDTLYENIYLDVNDVESITVISTAEYHKGTPKKIHVKLNKSRKSDDD